MATEDVIKFLHEKEYQHVKPLGKGSFSVVLSAISPANDSVAVKIIQYEDSWYLEEMVWPLLNHKNVLPLIEMIDIEYLSVKLFIMPRMPFVLVQMLASDSFIEDQNGLRRVKRWLSDTLDGLEYLHSTGFAHLDLKTNNVLISADDHALLCDFSGLDFIGVPLKTLCVPMEYSPPENYDVLRCKDMEGSRCDIWLFGLMTLNVLTKSWPSKRMGTVTDAESWKTNVGEVLLEALGESTFLRIMTQSFPSVYISDEELASAHDFVISMMQWDPDKRPSVQQMRRHSFLTVTESHDTICEKRSNPIEPAQIDTNPFLELLIGTETSKVKTSFRKNETESVEKDIRRSVEIDIESDKTNPFQDAQANSRNIPNPETKLEITEQMDTLNKCSSQNLEKTESIHETGEKIVPAVGGQEKTIRFGRFLFQDVDPFALEVADAPKQGMKCLSGIKLWFRIKWNQIFKKINKYNSKSTEPIERYGCSSEIQKTGYVPEDLELLINEPEY